MGDAMGHITFASIIASLLPNHRFLFMGGGKVSLLKKKGYEVVELPMLATYYTNNRVDLRQTVQNGARTLFQRPKILRQAADIIRRFDPCLVLTNYEYFTALAAEYLHLPCVSIDHQHILSQCRWPVNPGNYLGRLLLVIPLRLMYSRPKRYIIASFFQLPPKNPEAVHVTPSVLRPVVQNYKPTEGEHVLVYQTSPSFLPLLDTLKRLHYPAVVYGFGLRESTGNITFKPNSVDGFLEDLSSCRYAIVNGGHNVISEALYYGKPILCFPIRLAYEQFLNAFMIQELGYGRYSMSPHPDISTFSDFESRLDFFKSCVARDMFYGNDVMREKLEEIVGEAGG